MNQDVSRDPWNVYWQADNLDSCIATATQQDVERINRIWTDFAVQLESGAAVLDLATGNGSVPLALLLGNHSLRITAVDRADIDPLSYLSSPGELTGVSFLGGTNICSMPFEKNSFDAVTSQFGIEYAPLDEAIESAASVLKRAGRLQLLMHHADSEIVAPARLKLREMAGLLRTDGVIQRLTAFVNGAAAVADLDSAGDRHLSSGVGRSSEISGQIFEGVRRVLQSVQQGDRPAGAELASVMAMRLAADHDRLTQLKRAALTQDEARAVGGRFELAGISIRSLEPLIVGPDSADEALVGWQLCGEKR